MITDKKDIRKQALRKSLIFLSISWVIFILFYQCDLQYKMANLMNDIIGGGNSYVKNHIDPSFFASCLYCVVYLSALAIPVVVFFASGSLFFAFITFVGSWALIVGVFQDWFATERRLGPYQTLFGVLFLILYHLGTYGINYLKSRKRAKEILLAALEAQAERDAQIAERERREASIAEKVAKIMMEQQKSEKE